MSKKVLIIRIRACRRRKGHLLIRTMKLIKFRVKTLCKNLIPLTNIFPMQSGSCNQIREEFLFHNINLST